LEVVLPSDSPLSPSRHLMCSLKFNLAWLQRFDAAMAASVG
jgi:hypothetical protein